MHWVESEFGPVCMGIISGQHSRYNEFQICRDEILLPPKSDWQWQRGGGFAAQRNIIVRETLADERHFDWLWFIDDDHTFAPTIVLNLLKRRVPIVQPLVCTRKPPYVPYAYRWDEERQKYITLDWTGINGGVDGLIEVDASACGGMLIKREVLEAVPDPWFVEGKCGEGPGEDFYFSERAREAGYQGYVDTKLRMGHMADHALWPSPNPDATCEEDRWRVAIKLDHGVTGILPEIEGSEFSLPGNFGRQYLAGKHRVTLEELQTSIRGNIPE